MTPPAVASGVPIPRWVPAALPLVLTLSGGAIAYGRLEERVSSGFAASERRQESTEHRVDQHEVRLTANELLAGRVDAKLDGVASNVKTLLERSERNPRR